tara:strand:- start:602 stop:2689 length:2088 start_codon:yes stop_codon:yes gene_type:complete
MVIGLEGRWGSGKTSLLNFLEAELVNAQGEGVHTITIAPWLNGDASSLVSSLLDPIRAILKKQEQAVVPSGDGLDDAAKERIADVGRLLRAYGPKTARSVASIASVAGYFVPGAKLAADVLEATASAAEQVLPDVSTPTEIKLQVSRKLKELNIGFIVILDDLDRLEPEQAVEVVRLVRSVADFPRVVYLMCYDRDVLAQALKTGLKVADGDLYLQKIVQLTFSIPLPEPFDLRAQFLDEAVALYREIAGEGFGEDLLDDLKSAVDREGMGLSTPREVKLVLNSVRFIFPQVKDDVYFPDFCRLQLIKTTNYKLYKWLELYLSVRSVLVTEDAVISGEERKRMGVELRDLLPSSAPDSARSIWSLKRFVPGVADVDDAEKRVFNRMGDEAVSSAVNLKRLGSPFHYRFYFALTGPKTVMPDPEFYALLEFAGSDVAALIVRFREEVARRRRSGNTWFEHILNRFDDECIRSLSEDQLSGILIAFSDMMDFAMANDNSPRAFSLSLDGIANLVARNCLLRLKALNAGRHESVVLDIATEGAAINWLVGKFFRSQLFRHGRVGDESVPEDQWEISDELLDKVINILQRRVDNSETQAQIRDLPDILAYLLGWRNLSGDGRAEAWAQEFAVSDEGFVHLLEHLRGWAMSDKVYYPLSKRTVSLFLNWDEVLARLETLKHSAFAKQVAGLLLAIEQSHD